VRFAAIIILCVFGLTFGCAHSHDKFYYPNGTLCAEVKSTVFGTGETEKEVVNDCVDILYDTKDTGFSDNAGKLAEGLAKGAVKGVVPTP
jgi:Holliday junction resolvasome RuvABC endonuclease subunit